MQFLYHRPFKKKFDKLTLKIQEQFLSRLELFLLNPTNVVLNNHSVEKRFPGCRSINVTGDLRAIFYLKDQIAVFINIGTHSELYG